MRDGMGREVGGGFRMGNTCTRMADSCQCMAKPLQYCKVISLQLNKLIFKRKGKKMKEMYQNAKWLYFGAKIRTLDFFFF